MELARCVNKIKKFIFPVLSLIEYGVVSWHLAFDLLLQVRNNLHIHLDDKIVYTSHFENKFLFLFLLLSGST